YVRNEPEPVTISLDAYRGSWVALFFYPRDFTFVCPTELQAFARLQQEFRSEGAFLVGASTDSYYSHKAWFESDPRLKRVAFPIIADTSHRLSQDFGTLLDD